METLQILFYTDSKQFISGDYGTDELCRVLTSADDRGGTHESSVNSFGVKIKVDRVTRGDEGTRFDDEFLKPYHQIWFFLLETAKFELDREEIAALRRWMDQGNGVLITGDHAEKERDGLVGRGRALGQSIPRARHLRDWYGPSRVGPERTDSTVPRLGVPYSVLQRDAVPQELLLLGVGPVIQRRKTYHPIFYGAGNRVLNVLPDHPHEGIVTIPKIGPNDREWYAQGVLGSQTPPQPEVSARGIDRTRCEVYDLMAAWDGHRVGVGRILADASWHHYVHLNLQELFGGYASDPSVAAKIKDLYINQAIWLAPRRMRVKIAESLSQALVDETYAKRDDLDIEDWLLYPLAYRISAPMLVDLLRDLLSEEIPEADAIVQQNASFFLSHGLRELAKLKRSDNERNPPSKRAALCTGVACAIKDLEQQLVSYQQLQELFGT